MKKPITQTTRWMLQRLLSISDYEKYCLGKYNLNYSQKSRLQSWKARFAKQTPLAYLLGNIPFLMLIIQCRQPILIPRPETEQWVEWCITIWKKKKQKIRALDLCTGTGCIALALVKGVQAVVVGVDVNAEAIVLANENKKRNQAEGAMFMEMDVFNKEKLETLGLFDLIVANPPYISKKSKLPRSVLHFEDHAALFAEKEGMEFIEHIINIAPTLLTKTSDKTIPNLIVEFGEEQDQKIDAILKNNVSLGIITAYEIHKDYFGKPRWFSCCI